MVPSACNRGALPLVSAIIALFLIVSPAGAQETAFTYQGELKDGGTVVNAPAARLTFRLWDAETGGAQVGADCTVYPVAVAGGIFTAEVDFGSGAFTDAGRWLEIGADVTGGTTYTWMSPRQRVTAAPMAIYALHGGDSPWVIDGTKIYYNNGRVGIGTADPGYPLEVTTSSSIRAISGVSTDPGTGRSGVFGQTSSTDGAGVRGSATAGTSAGVYGEGTSSTGIGVKGYAGATSGTPTGVQGSVRYSGGIGLKGLNTASSGNGIAVYGEATSSTGFGGYFLGRGYFRDAVGIGTDNPVSPLDVAGTIRATGFQLPTAAQFGYVLTTDALGNGTWQAPTGGGGGIGGSGTASYLPKFNGATTLGNSVIYESTSGNVGIGTPAPSQKLHVLGTVRMNGLQLPVSPTTGHVLTADAAGNGTWQAPTGESLWQSGSGGIYYNSGAVGIGLTAPSTLTALDIETATTYGIMAEGGTYGIRGEGSTTGVIGAGGTRGVLGTGTTWGVLGSSTGGTGVKGESTTGSGVNAVCSGTGTSNPALYAANTNSNGIAVFSTCTSLDANLVAVNKGSGDIIKGFSGPTGGDLVFRVENDGRTSVSVLQITGGADLSEQFDVQPADGGIRPGMVVSIDPAEPGRLVVSSRAYDRTVAGVISGAGGVQPGMMMGQRGTVADGSHPVALTGRVYVVADASSGAILPGDLLTTSDTPGHAMKVVDHARAQGAILGKAMTTLSEGTGLVLVLVSLQ